MTYPPDQQGSMRSSMESYGAGWSGNPNDPNAPIETRPEGCICRYSDGYIDAPAREHDPNDEKCPLFECDECGHEKRGHGEKGCEIERGDQLVGEILQAMGPCPCELTQKDIELIARHGSLERGREIAAKVREIWT